MTIFNLKIAYIALTLLMVIILLLIGIKTIDITFSDLKKNRRKKGILIAGLLFWQLFVYIMANTGILDDFSFPPRFFVLLILPLFIFTGVFLYINRNFDWIKNIPENWLIYYQSFRIFIETLFVVSVTLAILNPEVTIIGYNYDMVFAYSAPIIGFLFYKKFISRKILIIWNFVGLLIIASIIFLFISSIFNPQLFGSETILLPKAVAKYPYILVAGFLMPSAVFIHVLSIIQLSKKSDKF